jgi:choice-of-anchor A domain-containing protein
MKIKLLPALLTRREMLVPMCALLASGMQADGALATGVTSNWRAFAMSGKKDSFQMSGTSMVVGDVAVANADYDGDDDDDDSNSHNVGTGSLRTFRLDGSAMITGSLSFDTRASGQVTAPAMVQGGYVSNWPTDSSMISQANAAKSQALYYSGLSNAGFSPAPGTIKTSSNLTLSGGLALNVLNLNELSLSGNSILTISGGVGQQFVINVEKKFSLSGNSKIVLSGGVDPLDVVFNFEGKKATMSGNTSLNGVLMAANGEFQGSGNAVVKGQVIASEIKLTGNSKIVSP